MASENKLNYWHHSLPGAAPTSPQFGFTEMKGSCEEKRGTLFHYKQKYISCTAAPHCKRTLKLCRQCSGTFAKHIRAACDCISPECVAFSVRCCPRLPHYSPKLAATASVPAFNETSALSDRKKMKQREERRQVTSALVYFTTDRSSMHVKTVK